VELCSWEATSGRVIRSVARGRRRRDVEGDCNVVYDRRMLDRGAAYLAWLAGKQPKLDTECG